MLEFVALHVILTRPMFGSAHTRPLTVPAVGTASNRRARKPVPSRRSLFWGISAESTQPSFRVSIPERSRLAVPSRSQRRIGL